MKLNSMQVGSGENQKTLMAIGECQEWNPKPTYDKECRTVSAYKYLGDQPVCAFLSWDAKA